VKLILAGLSLLIGSLLVFASCSDEKNPVQQYGNTITQSYKSAQKLDDKVNILEVRKSIQEFYLPTAGIPLT
jgi:PBP1b-binding outer membrane lipoprotein LpoB